jgi:hypothetical protein
MSIPEAKERVKAEFDAWNAGASLVDPASGLYRELIEQLQQAVKMGVEASRVAQDAPERPKALTNECRCDMCLDGAQATYSGELD